MNELKAKIVALGDEPKIDQQLDLTRMVLLEKIAMFDGYPAFGFFHIKKSLLTACFANFVTYVIILIQFRMAIAPQQE